MKRWMGIWVALCVGWSARASEGVAMRTLPTIVWADEVVDGLGRATVMAVEEDLVTTFTRGLNETFASAMARGEERASMPLSKTLGSVVHVGFKVSRAEELLTRFGRDKTIASIYLTGSIFVTNLQTGDLLASRSLTCVQPRDYVGVVDGLRDEDRPGVVSAAAELCMTTLTAQLAETFEPGRTVAHVVGQAGDKWVIDRGFLQGGYAGEVFLVEDDPATQVRIVEVQERLALATAPRKLARGTRLTRFGVLVDGGDAPRMMTMPGSAVRLVAPGVVEAEVSQLAADALSDAGFVLLPQTDAMFLAKDLESGLLNVTRETLVGRQSRPDVVVLPEVTRAMWTEREESSGVVTVTLDVQVAASFVDLRTGVVLYGTTETAGTSWEAKKGGRVVDPQTRFAGLIKDAYQALAQRSADAFSLQRGMATLEGRPSPSGEVSWTPDGGALGAGTIAEILAKGPEMTDLQGASLGRVETVVGSLRVLPGGGRKPGTERGQVMSRSIPVVGGMRIRGLPGTGTRDGRVFTLGSLTLDGGGLVEAARMRQQLKTALYVSPHLRSTLAPEDHARLADTFTHLASSSFALTSKPGHAPTAASHTWNVDLSLSATPLERVTTNRRKGLVEASRQLTATTTLAVTEVATGSAERLVHPRTGAVFDTGYPYERALTLKGQERQGVLPHGMDGAELSLTAGPFVFEVGQELVRRARLMLDAAANADAGGTP